MFSFDFDQETAANAAYDFIVAGKLSLIGQELSYPGFYLGPLHSAIQIIPYGVCGLKPDCVPYFFTTIGLITAYFLFATTKEIINKKTAVISALLFLTSSVVIGTERGPSSNYFLPLVSIFMFYSLHKYCKGEGKYLIAGGFIGGLATINFNPVFVFTLAAYFLEALISGGRQIKTLILSLVSAFINLIPLVIFNFRHENLLWSNFTNFLRDSGPHADIVTKPFFLFFKIILPYFNNYLFLNNSPVFLVITFCILLFGSLIVLKLKSPVLNFLLIWPLCVILGFTLYSRHIPDYYFIQILLPFILITSLFLSKNILIFTLIISAFLYSNVFNLLTFKSAVSYKLKKAVVNRVISNSNGELFNVYYNFPPGLNTGYAYLFKSHGKNPKDYSQTLYILDFFDEKQFNALGYYKTYGDKIKKIESIENMKIITVKNTSN